MSARHHKKQRVSADMRNRRYTSLVARAVRGSTGDPAREFNVGTALLRALGLLHPFLFRLPAGLQSPSADFKSLGQHTKGRCGRYRWAKQKALNFWTAMLDQKRQLFLILDAFPNADQAEVSTKSENALDNCVRFRTITQISNKKNHRSSIGREEIGLSTKAKTSQSQNHRATDRLPTPLSLR